MSPVPHVLVDATAIPPNRAGVGRYLAQLLPALAARGERLTVAVQDHDADWMRAAVPQATIVALSLRLRRRPARLAWEQTGLPRLARRVGADLIFSPHYTMPLASRVPVVATFHDATFFSLPEVHEPAKRRFFRAWIRITGRRAAAILVPSASARDELARWGGIPPERMRVAHHGVDTAVFHAPGPAQREAAAQLAGSSRWLAFLGTIEPRKNLAALVRAFDRVASDPGITRRMPDLALAIAGGTGWDHEFDGAVAHAEHRDRIRVLGFVPDDALPGLLGASVAVVYPSLGEGFGMPVAEAMACGAAVLTTRELALPEVGGEVAFYTDPDLASLERALRALLADDAERARRAQQGPARAAAFDWAASAEQHATAFRVALGWNA